MGGWHHHHHHSLPPPHYKTKVFHHPVCPPGNLSAKEVPASSHRSSLGLPVPKGGCLAPTLSQPVQLLQVWGLCGCGGGRSPCLASLSSLPHCDATALQHPPAHITYTHTHRALIGTHPPVGSPCLGYSDQSQVLCFQPALDSTQDRAPMYKSSASGSDNVQVFLPSVGGGFP